MASDSPDMGEQALSKAAEIGMTSQLDAVEDLVVDLRTDPFKLVQGELESAEIAGKGLVMQKELRTEELTLKTTAIAIDPMKAAFGEIELQRSTDAAAHVVLTEADIERAFNSDYIKEKLQNQTVNIDGQPLTVNTRQVKFQLPGDGKVALDAEIAIAETNETKQVAFTAIPSVGDNGHRVELTDVQYAEGKAVSPEMTEALLSSASELLDLRNFELEGLSLRLKQLDVQPGKITLTAQARVERFPGA